MTWSGLHRRGDVLRTVLDQLELRRDGHLPTDVDGVAETFADELDLLGALQLRWHARLSGAIERALTEQPFEADTAVVDAWLETAHAAPGLRAVLDAYTDRPTTTVMADALTVARRKERIVLAAMAGAASPSDPHAPEAGADLEERARGQFRPESDPQDRADSSAAEEHSILGRLKAVLAA